ncbi:MAG: chromate transporter [Clostridia bacterium]|nr:chromate transporter [Clostridia bacterium]
MLQQNDLRINLKKLMISLFRIGCIGFGGGSALIPVLFQRTVQKDKLVSQDDFNHDVAIATVTPGALPVEVSAGIGQQICGIVGMHTGSIAIALPGTLLSLLTVSLLSQFDNTIIRQINFLAIGVSAYIISVLCQYVRGTLQAAENRKRQRFSVAVIVISFALTCGKDLYHIMGITDAQPIFAIGTINVMAMALFLICWTHEEYTLRKLLPAIVIAVIFCLCKGKLALFDGTGMPILLEILMMVMTVYGLKQDIGTRRTQLDIVNLKRMLRECGSSLLLMTVLSIPSMLLFEDTLDYLIRGMLSSLMSFGGGDAYLALAGGMFVSSGLVQYRDFYSVLVPVVNATPGSILCKVLAGSGYFLGYRETESILAGFLVALAGFSCAIAMSCITFSVAAFFFDSLGGFHTFAVLKRVLRPIISGLLLTVCLGFFYSCLQVGAGCSWPDICAPVLCIILTLANLFYSNKCGSHPVRMVTGSGLCSFLFCNLFGIIF